MSVTRRGPIGFAGALRSTAKPHEWFDGLFVPRMARLDALSAGQPGPQPRLLARSGAERKRVLVLDAVMALGRQNGFGLGSRINHGGTSFSGCRETHTAINFPTRATTSVSLCSVAGSEAPAELGAFMHLRLSHSRTRRRIPAKASTRVQAQRIYCRGRRPLGRHRASLYRVGRIIRLFPPAAVKGPRCRLVAGAAGPRAGDTPWSCTAPPTLRKARRMARENGRDTSRDGADNRRETFFLTHWGPLWWLAQRNSKIDRILNGRLVNSASAKMPYRPNPFSTMSTYTSWASLTDKKFSSRHLPAAAPVPDLPAVDEVADMFARPDGEFTPCPKSTVLFSYFAAWFTDGFLRSDRTPPPRGRAGPAQGPVDQR